MTQECAKTRELCKLLEDAGAYIKAHVASAMNQDGWPDRWICHRLWHGHVEFKDGNGRLTPLQAKRLREIERRQPGTGVVVRFRDVDARLGGGSVMHVEDHGGVPLAKVYGNCWWLAGDDAAHTEKSTGLAFISALAAIKEKLR